MMSWLFMQHLREKDFQMIELEKWRSDVYLVFRKCHFRVLLKKNLLVGCRKCIIQKLINPKISWDCVNVLCVSIMKLRKSDLKRTNMSESVSFYLLSCVTPPIQLDTIECTLIRLTYANIIPRYKLLINSIIQLR